MTNFRFVKSLLGDLSPTRGPSIREEMSDAGDIVATSITRKPKQCKAMKAMQLLCKTMQYMLNNAQISCIMSSIFVMH